MDNTKLITVIVWATVVLVVYEALKSVVGTAGTGLTSANPLGVPTSTGNAALDAQLLQLGTAQAAAGALGTTGPSLGLESNGLEALSGQDALTADGWGF